MHSVHVDQTLNCYFCNYRKCHVKLCMAS